MTLSDGSNHPLAAVSAFPLKLFRGPTYDIRICGSRIGILVRSGENTELMVWDWRTGALRLVCICDAAWCYPAEKKLIGTWWYRIHSIIRLLERVNPSDRISNHAKGRAHPISLSHFL